MLKKIFPILILMAVFFFSAYENQVAGQPGTPMGPAPCWPPPCTVPLDGGISLLIAAGIALGGKKIYDFRKSAKNE